MDYISYATQPAITKIAKNLTLKYSSLTATSIPSRATEPAMAAEVVAKSTSSFSSSARADSFPEAFPRRRCGSAIAESAAVDTVPSRTDRYCCCVCTCRWCLRGHCCCWFLHRRGSLRRRSCRRCDPYCGRSCSCSWNRSRRRRPSNRASAAEVG